MRRLLLSVLVCVGCRQEIPRTNDRGPTSFRIEPVDPNTPFGSKESPLPFAAAMEFAFDVSALDHEGQVATWFDGDVHLDVNPVGELADGQPEWITLTNGVAENVQVAITAVHGPAAIWFEEVGEPDDPGSYATGTSPRLVVGNPTIRNMQETDNHRISPLAGDFVTIRSEDREIVVTAVTNDGFYCSDLADPQWGGLFVFTHSRARGVDEGDRVLKLSGTAEEFYGFTELGFPSWLVEGTRPLPAPIVLDAALVADDAMMEAYESGLVEVRDVTVCEPGPDFDAFGQWTVVLGAGDCAAGTGLVTVLSAFTVDWFDPHEHVGDRVARITGNLRYHSSAEPAWIIRPRRNDDMEL